MSHQDVEDLMPDLLSGDLPSTLTLRVESHLDTCPACRRAWSEYLAIWLMDGRMALSWLNAAGRR